VNFVFADFNVTVLLPPEMATELEYALYPKPHPSKDMSANPILANMLNESENVLVFISDDLFSVYRALGCHRDRYVR